MVEWGYIIMYMGSLVGAEVPPVPPRLVGGTFSLFTLHSSLFTGH